MGHRLVRRYLHQYLVHLHPQHYCWHSTSGYTVTLAAAALPISALTTAVAAKVVISPDILTSDRSNGTGTIDPLDVPGDITRFNVTPANWDYIAFIGTWPSTASWTRAVPELGRIGFKAMASLAVLMAFTESAQNVVHIRWVIRSKVR